MLTEVWYHKLLLLLLSVFFLPFLIRRLKAQGHRVHWAGLSLCLWSSRGCLWTLEFYSGRKNYWWSRSELLPLLKTVRDAWGGFCECYSFHFYNILGLVTPPSNLYLLSRCHILCSAVIISLLVSWLHELQCEQLERVKSCHLFPRGLTQRNTVEHYWIVSEQHLVLHAHKNWFLHISPCTSIRTPTAPHASVLWWGHVHA